MNNTNKFQHIFESKIQDAIIWKAKRIWSKATNPHAESLAVEQLTAFLLRIPKPVKRERYTELVPENINKFVANKDQRLNEAQTKYELLTSIYQAEKSEKNKKNLDNAAAELETITDSALNKLKPQTLKKYIKDEQDKKKQEQFEKVTKDRIEQGKLSALELGLPEDWEGNLYLAMSYGIAPDPVKNVYLIRNERGIWQEKSTFTMKVQFLIHESASVAHRIITMTNMYGQQKTLTFNTDDMTSLSSFKKVINRYSIFSFTGNDSDLTRLNEYLQVEEKHASQINTLGMNKTNKMWCWGNGIYDLSKQVPEFVDADDYGMVTAEGNKTFFIPSASKLMNDEDADDISPEKRFIHTDISVPFHEWSSLHYKVHGNNSIIGQLWICAAINRDLIFNNPSIRRMPLLFLYGQPGSGKGVFGESMMALYGYLQSRIMLESGGSTQKGILRKFAQFKNGVVWMDEYKNTIHKSLIGTIKQLYDGESYTKAVKSNDNRTESSPINSSGIVSGQDLPIIEAAVLERHILLQFDNKKRTDEEISNYNRLSGMEAQGLSSVLHEILNARKHFVNNFMEKFKAAYREARERLIVRDVKDRYIMNYAILLATFDTLSPYLPFTFVREDVINLLWSAAEKQNNLTKDNNDSAKFWDVVEFIAKHDQHTFVNGKHYKIEKDILWISLKDIHPLYIKELKSRGDTYGLEKAVLENYLKSDATTFVEYKRMRMGDYNLYMCGFNYEVLRNRYKISIVPTLENEDDVNRDPFGDIITGPKNYF